MNPKKVIEYGETVTVKLTEAERVLIRDEAYVGDELLVPLEEAESVGRHITVRMSLDDLEDLEDAVAAAGNHCVDRRLEERLDRLLKKLLRIRLQYEELEPGQSTRQADANGRPPGDRR